MSDEHICDDFERDALFNILSETEKLANVGGWEWDITSDVWTFTDNWLRIHGCSNRHLTTSDLLTIAHPDDIKDIRNAFDRAVAEGANYEIEHRIIRQDTGEERHISARGTAKLDNEGKAVKLYGSAQDITERILAEEALQRERALFKTIVDRLPVMITRYDPDANMLFLNHEFERKVGWTTKDVQDIDIMKEVYPDPEYREQAYEYMQRASREWKEFNVTSKAGQIVESEWSNIRLEDGTQVGIGIDISESKKIRETMEKSESLFRGLYNNMTSGSAIYEVLNDGSKGSDYIIKNFNNKSLEIEGKTLDQVVGKSLFDLRPNIDDYGLIPVMQKVWETGEPDSFPIKIYQDDIFSNYYENYIFKIPTGEVVTIYNDVTDQKNSEIALQESEKRFALAMEFTTDGLFDWNLETNEIYYSPGWKRMLGYEDDELPNDFGVWETLTDPEDVERSWKMQKELINKKRDRFEIEFRMKHKDGYWVDILSRANAIFNDNGEAVRIIGTHVNITERKKYENELKTMKAAIENSLSGFDIVDEKGVLVYANKSFASMYGFDSPDEMIGVSASQFCEDPSLPEKVIQTLKKEGEYEFEHKAKRKDGSTFDILMYARLAHDEHGNEMYPTTSIDISERIRANQEKEALQNQLFQSQKMESIGNLAGGIAHEFNNILSIIIGNNELIMEDLPEWSLSRESCEEIRLAGLRARDVVKHLLTFSRQDDSTKKPIDIRAVVKQSLKLIRSTTPTNIEIRDDLSPDCSPVLGDVTQINQILINLLNNSVYALPISGGRIDVALSNVVTDRKTGPSEKESGPREYVRLQVKDNGCGMDKEVIERIFDPYFTTKDVHEGSGLGLSVVHGIVENHYGSITCESSPGKGTTFTILIPAHAGSVVAEIEQKNTLPGKGECILFVDDEPSIAKLGKRHLEALGYTALSTTDPVQAVEMIKSEPNRFNLVISDMAMPEMPGDQLVSEILAVNPGIPIIICTGYSSRMSEAKASQMGVKAFVMKPFNKKELAKTIRKVMDEARG